MSLNCKPFILKFQPEAKWLLKQWLLLLCGCQIVNKKKKFDVNVCKEKRKIIENIPISFKIAHDYIFGAIAEYPATLVHLIYMCQNLL